MPFPQGWLGLTTRAVPATAAATEVPQQQRAAGAGAEGHRQENGEGSVDGKALAPGDNVGLISAASSQHCTGVHLCELAIGVRPFRGCVETRVHGGDRQGRSGTCTAQRTFGTRVHGVICSKVGGDEEHLAIDAGNAVQGLREGGQHLVACDAQLIQSPTSNRRAGIAAPRRGSGK